MGKNSRTKKVKIRVHFNCLENLYHEQPPIDIKTDCVCIKMTLAKSSQSNFKENLKNQATDLLQIHDETITKLRSLQNDDGCGCGSDHC